MRVGLFVAVMAALACAVACDDPPPTGPTSLVASEIVGVEVTGPDTIAPGQSAQFTAVVRLSDGSSKTASGTMDLRWGFNTTFLRINADGVATALEKIGDTTVTASVAASVQGGRISSLGKVITVVPEGTFRLIGRVSDADAPSVPVPGALVEVTPGPLVTTTDLAGQYRLYGVSADATVRITKAGFQLVERPLRLTAHATQDFDLPPDGARPVLSGPYTLAIDIGSSCSDSGISADLRHRRYDAVLTQSGSTVDVVLTQSRFRVNSIGRGRGFAGITYSGGATFTLFGFDPDNVGVGPFDYPNVVEQLPDGTVLIPSGSVAMVGGSAGLTGQMASGSFVPRFGAAFPAPTAPFFGGCNYLSPIVFTLTPR